MRKFWVVILAALALVYGGWTYWESRTGEEGDGPPATAAVTRGTVTRSVLATGVIEAENLLSVGARVSGQIQTLAVAVGQDVNAGDLIAQIDDLDQKNEVLRAKAELQRIEAQIAAKNASIREADLGLNRKRQLSDKNLTTADDLEAAEAGLAVARADLAALEAQRAAAEISVGSAELALERTRIVAPAAGTVVAVVAEEGQTVNAVQSTPTIVKIANLDRMVVKADVSEADVVRVMPGQRVSFTLMGEPDLRYDATLRAIQPAPASIRDSDTIDTEEPVYYQALFDVENPDRKLRIGMTAQVSVLLAEAENVLTVPSAALGEQAEDGTYPVEVWNEATQTREARAVSVGLNDTVTAEITGGLSEGELVVTDRASATSAATVTMRRPPGSGI